MIQTELRLGIGVHTGSVQVGNAGSTQQVKYGPRGPNVHLASRVEAATKELRVPLVATQATVERLSESIRSASRLPRSNARLAAAVDLYAVGSAPNERARTTAPGKRTTEHCASSKQGELQERRRRAGEHRCDDHAKYPSRFLLERVQQELGRNLRRRSTDKPAATKTA